MTTDVRVPMLPESVTDATVVEWHKAQGERVRADDNLVDLETDKVVLEVPAATDGILTRILVKAGETVTAETLLALIEPAAPDGPSDPTAIESPPTSGKDARAEPTQTPPHLDRPIAPGARRLIKELELDPRLIPGSGRDGRLHKADVMAWLDQREVGEAEHAPDEPAWRASTSPRENPPGTPLPHAQVLNPDPDPSPNPTTKPTHARSEQRAPMTRLRARIAERMLETQRQTAALTTFNEVDMSAVLQLRRRYRDEFEQRHGIRLGLMSFFVRAAVAALQRYPIVNAAIDGQDILYRDYIDIGIAVSTERGLVVPVLRDCDQLALSDIEQGIAAFGGKARDGSLTVEELTGGTFSITNGGLFGSLFSTPIINPPQSAILGMHKIEERPVAIEGQVEIRPLMYLALSYDHRLIDGRDAVGFLLSIKQTIEDPARLLLNL